MALPNNPQTRKEMYLSNMAGQGTALPSEPHTREEEYLDFIAKNGGGGGGTGDGDMKKSVYDNDNAVLTAGGIKPFVNTAISGKVDKVQGKGLSTNDYDDSAKAIVDGVTAELGNKADKVSSATNGDLASLDSNGNLTDSGKKASDFATASSVNTINNALRMIPDANDFDSDDFLVMQQSTGEYDEVVDVSLVKLQEVRSDSNKVVTSAAIYAALQNKVSKSSTAGLLKNDGTVNTTIEGAVSANASAISSIKDGTNIDSFGDVETALATKVDKVTGKGLSTNDYDDTEKAKVAGAFPRSEQAVLGAVNELDNTAVSTGIFTVNANKSVLVNGSTSSSWAVLNIGIIHPKAGHYLKGCPAGGGATYKIQAQKVGSSSPQYQDIGSGVKFTEDSNDDYVVSIVVGPNQSIDNKLFEPMISTSLLAPYAPYAMTNKELTEKVGIEESVASPNNANITIDSTQNSVVRFGNVVNFTVRITVVNAMPATGDNYFINLPFSPKTKYPFCKLIERNGPFAEVAMCYINPAGATGVNGKEIPAGNYYLIGTYICS